MEDYYLIQHITKGSIHLKWKVSKALESFLWVWWWTLYVLYGRSFVNVPTHLIKALHLPKSGLYLALFSLLFLLYL